MAQVRAEDVDLVLMCTSTLDDLFESDPQVQRDLGCKNALAFDITTACSGFVLDLVTGTCYIKGGDFKNVLAISADAHFKYVDWTDHSTFILIGDVAGAVVLHVTEVNQDCLLDFDLHSDGHDQIFLNAMTIGDVAKQDVTLAKGPFINPPKPSFNFCVQMNVKEVFRFAIRFVTQVIAAALEEARLSGANLDWLLLHQANQKIISAVAEQLHIDSDKVISNVLDYENTSAASILLVLDEAVWSGKVKQGDVFATIGFGAGLTWDSTIMR